MADAEPTVSGIRRWRVPYEWILGAMFVASFSFFAPGDSLVGRAVWLLAVGPLAGFALGTKPRPRAPLPRFGFTLYTAAAGWLYCALVYLAVEAKTWFWESRDVLERSIERLLTAWPLPVAPSLLGMVVAATMPGRYREFGVFANSAFLLVFALGWDIAMTPR